MTAATAEKTETAKKPRSRKPPAESTPAKAKREVSDSHKQAMSEGRDMSRKVGRYLAAIDAHRPKRGRKVTIESLRKRLAKVNEELESGDTNALQRLLLNQEKKDITGRISEMESTGTVDLSALEADFIAVAKKYAEAKGIDRATFKDAGVKPEVLK